MSVDAAEVISISCPIHLVVWVSKLMLMPIFDRMSLPIVRSHWQFGESKTSALTLPVMQFPNCGNFTSCKLTVLLESKLPIVVVVCLALPLFGVAPNGKLGLFIRV